MDSTSFMVHLNKVALIASLIPALASIPASSDSPPSDIVEEVIVEGSRRANFTVITEDAQKLVEMPGALGDPISAIYSLPGVVSSEGSDSRPAVRGSSPDDNRFYVDFLPVGYVFHEFTNSVFSEFILQDFKLYSAGFGPEYASVTGAVFDIQLREPRQQPLKTIIDLSMLRSGLFIEGGVTESSAFYLSGRQSLIHLFIPTGEEEDGFVVEKAPRDQDYQAKYTWQINSSNHLAISATGATDEAAADFGRESEFARSNPDYAGDAGLQNEYHGQNVVWDYDSRQRSFKVGLGRFANSFQAYWGDGFFFRYDLDQVSLRSRYEQALGEQHRISLGGHLQRSSYDISYDQIQFVCTEFDADCDLNRRDRTRATVPLEYEDHMVYVNDTWFLNSRWTLDAGFQWQRNDYTDETFFNPRLALSYAPNSDWIFTTKAGRYNRFPDLDKVAPTLGNPALQSPVADHYTFNIERMLGNGWSWSTELYYKAMAELPLGLQPDEPGADQLYSNDVKGKAYGVDLFINKNLTDRWYGWVALSYARSERTNERTGVNKIYQFDTPLIVNWVMSYQKSERFNVGWRWTVRSGAPYTPIVGVQENPWFENAAFPVYGDPFSERLPTYSRLDVRLKWDFTMFGIQSAAILDILNALNQDNVSDRSLDYDRVNLIDREVHTEDTESPGIIPAATLRLEF